MTDTTTPSDVPDGELDEVAEGLGYLVDADTLSPDDLPDDERESIEWLTTGGIRCRIEGVWYRLRRPNMGELRRLHEALEQVRDDQALQIQEIQQAADRLRKEFTEARAELKEILDTPLTGEGSEDLMARSKALTARVAELQREESRTLNKATASRWDAGEKWWRTVFKTLRAKEGPPVPKNLPSWVGSDQLPTVALDHWMRVPLGRGGHRKNGR